MNRSPSYLAQFTFEIVNKLQGLSARSNLIVKLFARAANRIAKPIARKLGAHHTIVARLYGHSLTMPAEHFLPAISAAFPQFNRPLSLTIEAIARSRRDDSTLTVIDVGANIGETVAIIEQRCPNLCSYLCIEPDRDLAELCKVNHKNNNRVQVEQSCIGEEEGAGVWLEDDGRANPSTRFATEGQLAGESCYTRLVRLDTVASPFAEACGRLSLIKVDTEGHDFSVLRSGSKLLGKYKPAVYFEWCPRFLIALNEEVWSGFEYLAEFGYRYFVFFTSQGDFYCKTSDPDRLFLRSLANIALKSKRMEYFDVCASTQEMICNALTELSISQELGQV
ncbi:MAG: FkbM family methyltransferase [Candidatus Acidiferrales bacterium]